MTRKEKKTFPDALSAATFTIETVLDVWGTNSTLVEKTATLEVASFDLHSDWIDKWTKPVVLAPNASTELFSGPLPGQPTRTKASEVPRTIVVSARLLDDDDGAVLGRYSNWCVFFLSFPFFVFLLLPTFYPPRILPILWCCSPPADD
jgi:beta-mannosidase